MANDLNNYQIEDEFSTHEVDASVAKFAQSKQESPINDNIVVTSTRVKLRVKQVSSMLVNGATQMFERPQPPRVYNADLGKTYENPNDPDYVSRVQAWQSAITNATIDVMILMGTEIVSVPRDFPKPDSEDWAENLQTLNFKISANPKHRYLAWVKYVACPKQEDIAEVLKAVGRLSGVSEEDAEEAADNFRS